MNLTSFLYKAARMSADAKALSSGSPKRATRRAKKRLAGGQD